MTDKVLLFLVVGIGLLSCQEVQPVLSIGEIRTPTREGGEPNLFVSEQGKIILSWIKYLDDTTDVLQFSTWENEGWSIPLEVARGTDWFVNWADFPSISFFKNSDVMAAHWLQKSDLGTYDYDVRIALSKNGGKTWEPSFIPHTDGIAAEHGFVTMLPLENNRMFAVWLDGRNTKGYGHSDGHAHQGAMTLRSAEFDQEGNLYEEVEMDNRVCDCCQTDAAMTSTGPVVVYRDRSDSETRDIAIVRKVDHTWTTPAIVHHDHWTIAGCPVNGPAIAARENSVVVAWFTGAGDSSKVKVVFSQNAGVSFSDPIQIDDGYPVGRVDVVLDHSGDALITWIENTEDGGEIRIVKVGPDSDKTKSTVLTKIGTTRQNGFPILEKWHNRFLLAWTSVDTAAIVRTMMLTF